jgi:His/Glu/Gln/Arg/opine family amino acid ABC transporter permease subunit
MLTNQSDFSYIIEGLSTTLQLLFYSALFTLVGALLLAMGRNSRLRVVRVVCGTYVEVLRSVPLVALLLLVFFGLPQVSEWLILPGFWAAVVAISASEAAFTSEALRGAIRSVPQTQWDAAASIALTRFQTYRKVVLPQAALPAIPVLVNMTIYVLKATALASLITVSEMTLRAGSLIVLTAEPLKTYGLLLLLYVCISTPLGLLGHYSERRFGSMLGAEAKLG